MDPLARVPMLLVAYQIPPGNTPETYALRVLGDIAGRGQSSRLYQSLVKEKQLATDIQIQTDARRGPSLMYFTAMLRPGVKPEDVEKAMYDVIAAIAKDGVTSGEIDKVRMGNLRREVQARESALQLANRIGNAAVYFNDPNLINTALEKYNAVTADDIKNAAGKYLVRNVRAVVLAQPEAGAAQEAAGGQQ
jgi:predicted Zn-dependent peptidase